MLRVALLLCLCLLLAVPALAQDTPSAEDVRYDDVVEGDVSDEAFYDWWQLQATEGDVIVISMAASDGLAPLLGILDAGGDLVARSDFEAEAAPDAAIELEYTAAASGQHTIVATRAGNIDGTTSGHYVLRIRRANPPFIYENPYQPVVFPCDDTEATTVATLEFAEDPGQADDYRITVYGLDGFEPVILVSIESQNFEFCNINADRMVDDAFTFPGEETRTVQADQLHTGSQLTLGGAEQMSSVRLTIGGARGVPGRYMAFIEGFQIADAFDADFVSVRLGPLTAETTSMDVYMVAAENSRLDPQVELLAAGLVCDDAGRRGCADVPSFNRAGATIHEGAATTIVGDRFDAGLRLNPGSPDPLGIELRAFNGNTTGAYVLVVIGELPARP